MPLPYHIFLGGHDLEMVTIGALARSVLGEECVSDAGLKWGARASDYGSRIAAAADQGLVPVLVELEPDIPLPDQAILIDHHGDRAGGASALRQIHDLLGPEAGPWTRWFALVDANDTGHVQALQAMGATPEEVQRVRVADRAAQGITPEEEASGAAALAAATTALDGTLLVVRLPHDRTATVTDPLAISGEDRDLLVLGASGTHFFGSGRRIAALDRAHAGGWRGGELPRRGFWGIGQRLDAAPLLDMLANAC